MYNTQHSRSARTVLCLESSSKPTAAGIVQTARGTALKLAVAVATTFTYPMATAGDPSSVVDGFAKAPPEAQVKIVRIILDDLFGTPQELKARLGRECSARQQRSTSDGSATPPANAAAIQEAAPHSPDESKSKEAILIAMCAGPIRRGIEHFLSFKPTESDATQVEEAKRRH